MFAISGLLFEVYDVHRVFTQLRYAYMPSAIYAFAFKQALNHTKGG